jgi:hypothetical protein
MSVLYWLNDTETYARLIEQVRPFVEAHGSAEQRAGFLINMLGFLLRRDRYRVTDGTVEIARAVYAAAQEAEPSPSGGPYSNWGSRSSGTETWMRPTWRCGKASRKGCGGATCHCNREPVPTS